jgi:signal transduction histidine kinase
MFSGKNESNKMNQSRKLIHKTFSDRALCNFSVLILLSFLFFMNSIAHAQQLIQIRTYDQQLQPMKNIEVSVNNKEYISVGSKAEAFIELNDNELPIKTIKIKNEELEPASWNHSKGILEIVVRKKSYQLAHVAVRDADNKPVANLSVIFKGKKNATFITNAEGKFDIMLGLDEKLSSADQFSINGYETRKLQASNHEHLLTVSRIKSVARNSTASVPQDQQPAAEDYFKNFDISKVDSIQSLTVFYAVFKNLEMKKLNDDLRKQIDEKFNQLVFQLQDSLRKNENTFSGKISDSSFVRDDIKSLLSQASEESITLQMQRDDFDKKIRIINEKLERGITNLDTETRSTLLSDLLALEQLLSENENRFYKNLVDYREIINGLKEKYFDFQQLESQLSESEARRLEEQRIFRQRLIGISALVLAFAALSALLISLSSRLKRQKKELMIAHAEVKRINENLENIVFERTKSLAEAHRELDTFLYRASHDLRTPVSSIIGLCNIALYLSDGETKELVMKVANTTEGMDKLLKKLSIISEINQPTNYTAIRLKEVVENVHSKFSKTIESLGVEFQANCNDEVVLHSFPNLVDVIITNLIENALFYSVMREPLDARVEFAAAIIDNHIEFSVYDNGIGVDQAIQHRLFDMFFKGNVDSKGNGLGLYIVQKSVQALEGNISVQSEPGRFTRFIVKLPLALVPKREKEEVAVA